MTSGMPWSIIEQNNPVFYGIDYRQDKETGKQPTLLEQKEAGNNALALRGLKISYRVPISSILQNGIELSTRLLKQKVTGKNGEKYRALSLVRLKFERIFSKAIK